MFLDLNRKAVALRAAALEGDDDEARLIVETMDTLLAGVELTPDETGTLASAVLKFGEVEAQVYVIKSDRNLQVNGPEVILRKIAQLYPDVPIWGRASEHMVFCIEGDPDVAWHLDCYYRGFYKRKG